ncbi:hypothetical protein C1645_830890 [Glomus cerebriforme]|uniref:Uncharacterized protein n=1 Tax=Glomus cerebriforme TaxID=658196 RepID=A0A397SGK1_9GLOM|nr:hypothetical protein C1645_830890 [Glomus cerebriforme]
MSPLNSQENKVLSAAAKLNKDEQKFIFVTKKDIIFNNLRYMKENNENWTVNNESCLDEFFANYGLIPITKLQEASEEIKELRFENDFLKSKLNQEVDKIDERFKSLKLEYQNEDELFKVKNKKKNISSSNASQKEMFNHIINYINRIKTDRYKEDFKDFFNTKLKYDQLKENGDRKLIIKNLLLSMKGHASAELSKTYLNFYYFMNSYDDKKDFESDLKETCEKFSSIYYKKKNVTCRARFSVCKGGN